MNELKNVNKKLNNENKELKKQIEELNDKLKEIKDKESNFNKKEEELNNMKMQFQDLLVKSNSGEIEKNSIIESLQNESVALKEEYNEQILTLNTEIKSLKEKNNKLIEENFNLKKIKSELESNNLSLQNQLKNCNKLSSSINKEDLNYFINEEEERSEDEDGDDYEKKMAKMEKEISKLKAYKSKYYNLEQENEKIKAKIKDLETENSVLNSLKEKEKEKEMNHEINYEKLLKNYKDLKVENQTLINVIEGLKQKIKESKDKNDSQAFTNDELEEFKNILNEKDEMIISLETQLNEYKKKCDDILSGKSKETKDKQIEILINEVNSIRKKILNEISYNNRISNFDEFIEVLEKIK